MEPDSRARPVVVVGAALVDHGRVLAARRCYPVELAGGWEFPGGKVEAGEDPAAALEREIGEELGCSVRVTDWLDGEVEIGPRHVLRVARCVLVAGEPVPLEHDAVRWLAADQLDSVAWLPADVPFLAALRVQLHGREGQRSGPGVLHGVFFEEGDARAVAVRLVEQGFEASVTRDRFAGEDDDEDHPWSVTTDAPVVMLELLVEQYDGWLDEQPAAPAVGPSPIDLPTAPKRVRRP